MSFSNPQEGADNEALRSLRDAVINLDKTTGRANHIMIILTIVLVLLGIPTLWLTYKMYKNSSFEAVGLVGGIKIREDFDPGFSIMPGYAKPLPAPSFSVNQNAGVNK